MNIYAYILVNKLPIPRCFKLFYWHENYKMIGKQFHCNKYNQHISCTTVADLFMNNIKNKMPMSGKEFSKRNRLRSMVCDFASSQFLLGGPFDKFALIVKGMSLGFMCRWYYFIVLWSILISLLTKEGEANYPIKLQTMLQTSYLLPSQTFASSDYP